MQRCRVGSVLGTSEEHCVGQRGKRVMSEGGNDWRGGARQQRGQITGPLDCFRDFGFHFWV